MSESFKTIMRFQYSAEAQIIKGRLESEGIKVFLLDNLTIDADPLVSNAIGGVKLKVPYDQVDRANSVLNSISKYSFDNEGNIIKCPNCKSEKIEFFSTVTNFKSLFWFIVGFLFSSLPIYTKYNYKCENCKTEFNLE